ncbi:CocE/NonD family hydrolase, partial [candidate division KSB1 bacterium]|nr:CocE/NonD family hydrolase [candidate division KSB1 bacterium]
MNTRNHCLSQNVIIMGIIAFLAPGVLPAQETFDIRTNYSKTEYMIPMRDGTRIYTQIYSPRDQSEKYPIMLSKTPYGVGNYGPDNFRSGLGPSIEFAKEGFIFVYQDHRGKGQSEGEFIHHPVYIPDKKSPEDIDDSSDTYDSIEWLLKNTRNNGRVGMWGVSYGGWHTAMGIINAHPALKAASPQGTPGDQFIGDDYHHYGAFRLLYAFTWTSGNARIRGSDRVTIEGEDAYDFFLKLGPISNVNKNLFKNQVPTWNEFMEHGVYDDYWLSKNVMKDMYNVTFPVLNVVGWFDAEDYYGALNVYYSIEEKNPDNKNILVAGPWSHGGWGRGSGDRLYQLRFDSNTSEYFRTNIQFPFFNYYLKDKGTLNIPEAQVFITGSNQWRSFDTWPPKEAEVRNLYFHAGGVLSFNPPSETSSDSFDSFVSDPDNPVRYTAERRGSQGNRWIIEDQRFASGRPDVLVYESEVLTEDITIAGPIIASLNVSTTGTDADWIVKLIDVYPPDAPENLGNAQIMLAGEVFRSKFRNSFANPEPLVPNRVTTIEYDLLDKAHTFLKGHRIMVQLQSTWFPLIDRNPQKFVDIYN